MANEVSIIETRLTASTDEHDKKIAASEKKLNDFGKNADDSGFRSWTSKVGASLQKFGTELTIGLTLPLVAIGKQITDVGFAYERAMNTFQAVTRASAVEMAAAGKVAEKLGADMTLPATSAADAAAAMTELAKGGFSAQQAMDAARGALQLAAAAQISEAQAAEITANALNTFHLAATESVRVSDLLAAASNASSAEITDIAHAMQQAGSSAAALHIPIEDLVTAIGEMANAGIKGSDAGTSLKTMMAALTPSTEKAGQAMKALGIDAFDAQGHFVGFEAIIRQAAPALAKMTDEQKAYAIEAAFGSDAQRAANIILGQGVDAFNKMKDAVGQSGAAAELAAAKTKGLSGAWDGFISQMETAGLKVFQALAPTIENVVRKLADMTAGLATVRPEIIQMGAAAATVGGTAGPLAVMIGKLAQLGKGGLITLGVIAGSAAMAAAYASDFGNMRNTVDSFAKSLLDFLGTSKTGIDDWGRVWRMAGIVVVEAIDQILSVLGTLLASIRTMGEAMVALFTLHWDQIPGIVDRGAAKVDTILSDFNSREKSRSDQFFALLEGNWTEYYLSIARQSAKGGENFGNQFIQGFQKSNPIPQIQGEVKSDLQKFIGEVQSLGFQGGQKFSIGMKAGHDKEAYHSPHFLISATLAALNTLVVAAVEPAHKAGQTAGEGITKGASTALGNLDVHLEPTMTKAGKKMASAIKKAFKEELGRINEWLGDSGLKLTEDIAKLLTGKIIIGLRELSKVAEESRNKMIAWGVTLQTAFQQGNKGLEVFLEDGRLKIKETSAKIVSNIQDVAKKIGEVKFKNPFELLADDRFAEAVKRTGLDIIRIQTESDDKIKEEVKRTNEVLKESWADGLEDTKEKFKDTYEKLSQYVGKGLADVLVQVSKFTGTSLTQMTNWATGTLDIIGALPGKLGEKLRRGADVFLDFVNRVDTILHGLHKIFDSIPDGLGKAIEQIKGHFKKGSQDIEEALKELDSQLGQVFVDSGNKAGGKFSDGFIKNLSKITAGIASAIGLIGSVKGGDIFGAAGSGGVLGSIIGGLFKHSTLGGVLGLIGGGIAGLIGKLFGGKSKEQKEAEERAKQQAAQDAQKFAAELSGTILDNLNKGFELLEKLQGFSEVPRKAIKRFLNEVFLVLDMFVTESARFKTESLEKAKAVTENLGGTFELLLSGADLIEKIKGIEAVTQEDVDKLFASVDKILDGWFSLVEYIDKGVAKRAGKIGGLLQTSLETIQMIPATIKAMTEVPDITDEQIEKPFVWGKKILDKFFDLADQFKALAINRMVKTAEAFGKIFESGKSMFEFFKLWSDYKPIDSSIFDAVNADFDRVKNWFIDAIAKVDEWLGLEETLEDKITSLGERMSALGAALSGAFSGTAGQNLTFQAASASTASLAPATGSSSSAGGSQPVVVNVNVAGSLIHQSQLPEAIAQGLQALQRQKRLTVNIL